MQENRCRIIIGSLLALLPIGLCLWLYIRLFCSLPTPEAFGAALPPGSQYDPVSLDVVSEEMRSMVIAMDQPDFYTRTSNPKFSSLLRAVVYAWQCSRGGMCSRDGGTILQRVVMQWHSSMGGPPLNTFQGELYVLFMSRRLARCCTQDEILAYYLNQTFYGDGVYGVEAAAQYYFDKPAADLTLGEAVVLRSLTFSPLARDAMQIEEIVAFFLQQMVDLGYITEEQAQHAQETTSLPDSIDRY